MHRNLIAIVFLLLSVTTYAQEKPTRYTLSGYVKDASSGEALIGANVYLKETMKGVFRPIPMVFILYGRCR
ncbi:MAG: hypothetical protein R2847_05085 [Bacteroidia bacterium]